MKGRPHYYSPTKTEYASLRFDLTADFSSLFGWNTKQVFVWVLATYPNPDANATAGTPLSQAIIWDAILQSPVQADPPRLATVLQRNPYGARDNSMASSKAAKKAVAKQKALTGSATLGRIRLRDQKPKYKIPDPSGHVAHLGNVTLEVGWNVQPWVGALAWTNRVWTIARWAPLQGGRSEAFALPGIKGAETVVGKGEVPSA